MGILSVKDDSKVPRLDFEFSSACDHKCGHCYNVWNASEDDAQAGYPQGQLNPEEMQRMMRTAVEGSGAEHITITDNAIIPLKERVVDEFYDPLKRIFRALTGGKKKKKQKT